MQDENRLQASYKCGQQLFYWHAKICEETCLLSKLKNIQLYGQRGFNSDILYNFVSLSKEDQVFSKVC